MASTVIHKLMMLTNHFIGASGDVSSRDIRDQLVDDVFPSLSDSMKREIANITEYNEILRSVMRDFEDRHPIEQEAIAIVLIRRMRRGERAARDDEELMAFATSPERRFET